MIIHCTCKRILKSNKLTHESYLSIYLSIFKFLMCLTLLTIQSWLSSVNMYSGQLKCLLNKGVFRCNLNVQTVSVSWIAHRRAFQTSGEVHKPMTCCFGFRCQHSLALAALPTGVPPLEQQVFAIASIPPQISCYQQPNHLLLLKIACKLICCTVFLDSPGRLWFIISLCCRKKPTSIGERELHPIAPSLGSSATSVLAAVWRMRVAL